ncbi:DUF6266 family protein [Desertivirga xinjiangensis]|uniref:DUF6266 family protein n=1 Tax=Desertivirga xinjiangensis TaxID=539206 RepID=UPI00210B7162|nr:DUF6266 family protein [Pedobacter xinjiangensis]
MGIIKKGANGGFSGKAGSVVGSSWKDIDYIKGLPKKSSKPASQSQLEQQARFALAVKVLQPITSLLSEGFKGQNSGKATGYNMALQHFLSHAITGAYPAFTVDYKNMLISKGSLTKPASVTLAADAGSLTITWSVLLSKYGAFSDDEAIVLVYNPAKNIYLPAEGSTRADGELQLDIPEDFDGDTLHVFLFFTNRDGSKNSESLYAGQIVV